MARLRYRHPDLGWTPTCGDGAVGTLKYKDPVLGWTPVCARTGVEIPPQDVVVGGTTVHTIQFSELESIEVPGGRPPWAYRTGIMVSAGDVVTSALRTDHGFWRDEMADPGFHWIPVQSAPFARVQVVPTGETPLDAEGFFMPYGRPTTYQYTSGGNRQEAGTSCVTAYVAGEVMLRGAPLSDTAMIAVTSVQRYDHTTMYTNVGSEGYPPWPTALPDSRAGAIDIGDGVASIAGTHSGITPGGIPWTWASWGLYWVLNPVQPYETPGLQIVVGVLIALNETSSPTISSSWGSNLFAGGASWSLGYEKKQVPFMFIRDHGDASIDLTVSEGVQLRAWWAWDYDYAGGWDPGGGEITAPIKYPDQATNQWTSLCCGTVPQQ